MPTNIRSVTLQFYCAIVAALVVGIAILLLLITLVEPLIPKQQQQLQGQLSDGTEWASVRVSAYQRGIFERYATGMETITISSIYFWQYRWPWVTHGIRLPAEKDLIVLGCAKNINAIGALTYDGCGKRPDLLPDVKVAFNHGRQKFMNVRPPH